MDVSADMNTTKELAMWVSDEKKNYICICMCVYVCVFVYKYICIQSKGHNKFPIKTV